MISNSFSHTAHARLRKPFVIDTRKQIISGPEYGTTEAAWKGILTEAERVSDLHMNMKDQLCNDVMQEIRVWQKENYHKVSRALRRFISVFFPFSCL